jgi:hypothetical protein
LLFACETIACGRFGFDALGTDADPNAIVDASVIDVAQADAPIDASQIDAAPPPDAMPPSATAQIIVGGTSFHPPSTQTSYNLLVGANQSWATASDTRLTAIPANGTLNNLRVNVDTPPGDGGSLTITVRRDTGGGPVATALACTIANQATSCSNTGSVAVSAGHLVDLQVTPTNLVAGTSDVHHTLQFTSSTPGQSILMGTGLSSGLLITDYMPLHGLGSGLDQESSEALIPTSGTLQGLRVNLSSSPIILASRTFTVMRNGNATGLECTVNSGETACSSNASVALNANDRIVLRNQPSITVVGAPRVRSGVVFRPSNTDEFILTTSEEGTSNNATVRFYYPHSAGGGANTEAERNQLAQTMIATRMVVQIDTAPGAGSSYRFRLRQNFSNTPLTCVIQDSATSCTVNGFVPIGDDDLLSVLANPSNTPNAFDNLHIGVVAE